MKLRHATDYSSIALAMIAGFGLGAIAMYVLDPVSGPRRRALARDKAASVAHHAVDGLRRKSRDRAPGAGAETAGVLEQVRRGANGE